MMAITVRLKVEVSLVGPLQLFLVTVGKDKESVRFFYNPGSDFLISHLLLIQSMSIISNEVHNDTIVLKSSLIH